MSDHGSFHRPPRSFPPAMPGEKILIARPPGLARRGAGALIQILLPVLGSLGIVAFALITPSKLFLIVAGVFVVISLFGALASHFSQRRSGRRSARTERRLYRRHLAEREQHLRDLHARQHQIAERLYPEPERLTGLAAHRRNLWERRPGDGDFLAFRLGTAAVPLACPVELALADDPLVEYQPDLLAEAQSLVERYRALPGLALVESLGEASVVTVSGPRRSLLGLTRALLAQAATFRAPGDLRVMACFPAELAEEWAWLKWLPHARSRSRAPDAGAPAGAPSLLLAPGPEALARLLDEHVQPRLEQLRRIESSSAEGAEAAVDAPELLLVLDGFHAGSAVARLPLVRELALRGRRLKVRTLCLVAPGDAEPPEAELRVAIDAAGTAQLERTGPRGYRIAPVQPDALTAANAEQLARALAPLRLEESSAGIDLAADLRLTALLDEPAGELCAAIGRSEDGDRLVLDLKQAAEGGMGPHGLIVGATGSGKSELLRSIVAGLAAWHHPEDLCFVFVDFKGGAAFAELSGLPHAAGMITNLQHDLSLIDRMQAALFGEMQRRQSMLRQAGNVDDVAAYRKLARSDSALPPLPHLLLIVDEFGELLANRPEFIDLFLAIGRVGRSLGMHLLLSSQRLEEGRLRGLEGHLRYRICLRTYSAQESKAVLGTSDAFLLPPYPGVGYVSVDNDVYKRFKTALVTTPHDAAAGRRREPFVGSFELSAAPGDRAEPAAAPAAQTDLDALVARLNDQWAGDSTVHQVWLPPLPHRRSLSSVLDEPPFWARLGSRSGPAGLRACIGLLDRPAEQRQDPFWLDLAGSGGHLAIVGAPQSGKSTALRTLLSSLFLAYRPDELRAYVLDFGGGLLRTVAPAPHVGGVAGRVDVERVQATVRQVHALLAEREAGFRERGIDSMAEARSRARRGELDPEHAADVLLVIDNWAALLRDHEELAEPLAELAAGGLQHGIHLLVTAGRWADLRQAIREAFGSRLELRLNDPMESDFGRRVAETVPPDTPGRGVTPDGLQFQIALPRMDGRDGEEELGQALAATIEMLRGRWDGPVAPPVRVLPDHVSLSDLPPAGQPGVAVGLEELTLAPVVLDLPGQDQHLLALGDPASGRTSLLRTVAHALAAQAPPEARMVVVDFRRGLLDLAELPIRCTLASRPPQVEAALTELRELTVERLRALDAAPLTGGAEGAVAPVYVLIDDYDLVGGLPLNPLGPLADLIVQGRDAGIHVVLARATGGASRAMLDPVLSRLVESGAPAIVLSGDPHEGPLVRGLRAEPMPPGRGRLIRRRGRPVVVQLAQAEPLPRGAGPAAPVAGSRGRL